MSKDAPQRCVLSPLLFSVYINEIICNMKNADDMALNACLKDEYSLSQYYQYVEMLISWFDSSFLEFYAQKTQKMCFGRGRVNDASHPLSQPLMIKGRLRKQCPLSSILLMTTLPSLTM